MPILKKPQTPANAPKPAPSKAKVDAFAERANAAGSKGGFIPPEPGVYNALITEIVPNRDDEGKGESVYIEVTITDDSAPGKACRIYFNFTDADGNDLPGYSFFNSARSMLGWDEPLESWDSMVEKLAEIAEQQPWVVVEVKKKGKYTNVYLQSVPENQDDKPSL